MTTENKIKVEFWSRKPNQIDSELIKVEEWENNEESFIRFYNNNNQLKYCNGTYYSFKDKKVNEKYLEFFAKWHTIPHYYNAGVVD